MFRNAIIRRSRFICTSAVPGIQSNVLPRCLALPNGCWWLNIRALRPLDLHLGVSHTVNGISIVAASQAAWVCFARVGCMSACRQRHIFPFYPGGSGVASYFAATGSICVRIPGRLEHRPRGADLICCYSYIFHAALHITPIILPGWLVEAGTCGLYPMVVCMICNCWHSVSFNPAMFSGLSEE